ncbi:flagellar hook-length control protein FliK [Sphingomonas sp. ID0503]|uniref:flagellar hook-length control protein FliK n=1 Tax=Sphingomonas sp. ID0503 TaxID=3399691 RepID=UPI003AFAC126
MDVTSVSIGITGKTSGSAAAPGGGGEAFGGLFAALGEQVAVEGETPSVTIPDVPLSGAAVRQVLADGGKILPPDDPTAILALFSPQPPASVEDGEALPAAKAPRPTTHGPAVLLPADIAEDAEPVAASQTEEAKTAEAKPAPTTRKSVEPQPLVQNALVPIEPKIAAPSPEQERPPVTLASKGKGAVDPIRPVREQGAAVLAPAGVSAPQAADKPRSATSPSPATVLIAPKEGAPDLDRAAMPLPRKGEGAVDPIRSVPDQSTAAPAPVKVSTPQNAGKPTPVAPPPSNKVAPAPERAEVVGTPSPTLALNQRKVAAPDRGRGEVPLPPRGKGAVDPIRSVPDQSTAAPAPVEVSTPQNAGKPTPVAPPPSNKVSPAPEHAEVVGTPSPTPALNQRKVAAPDRGRGEVPLPPRAKGAVDPIRPLPHQSAAVPAQADGAAPQAPDDRSAPTQSSAVMIEPMVVTPGLDREAPAVTSPQKGKGAVDPIRPLLVGATDIIPQEPVSEVPIVVRPAGDEVTVSLPAQPPYAAVQPTTERALGLQRVAVAAPVQTGPVLQPQPTPALVMPERVPEVMTFTKPSVATPELPRLRDALVGGKAGGSVTPAANMDIQARFAAASVVQPPPMPIGVQINGATLASLAAAGAIVRNPADDPPPADVSGDAIAALAGVTQAQPVGPAAVSTPGQAVVDTSQQDWMTAMIDRISEMQGADGSKETRIRLLPDALGAIDISFHQKDGEMRVSFNAENPHARALLAEHASRLQEMADQRGLKLNEAQAGGNGPAPNMGGEAWSRQQQNQQQQRLAENPASRARATREEPADAPEPARAPRERLA